MGKGGPPGSGDKGRGGEGERGRGGDGGLGDEESYEFFAVNFSLQNE
ncbi:MAG: hypothetical protein ACHBN1_14775 [Heteroscytonema crispum UTEX LB 1556]